MRPRGLWTFALGIATTLSACADPCVDDGLGQKGCPADADQDGSGEGSGTGTEAEASGSESGEAEGMTCDLLRLQLEPKTPTMLLLVDQSGSMDAAFDINMTTRWEAVRATLLDAMNGLVAQFESEIRFGLALYTANWDQGPVECPLLIETPPAIDNYDEIVASFDGSGGPQGDTPTGESVATVAMSLAADPDPNEKYIVLATDGEPDNCEDPDADGKPGAVMAVQGAYADGIETFIISVGDEVSDAHLQEMANAGAGVQPGDPDATFYKALDQQALFDAFNEIIQGVRNCEIMLDQAIKPELANLCTVTVNGDELPLDDPDGWRVNSSVEIELIGMACANIQEGVVTVEMSCDCSALE
jgi:hypothetical protein